MCVVKLKSRLLYANFQTVKMRFFLNLHEHQLAAVVVCFKCWKYVICVGNYNMDKYPFSLSEVLWNDISTNTHWALLRLCERTDLKVGWKQEYTLGLLREDCRCLQSSIYSQRTLYSCINSFQDTWFTARLMDYSLSFPNRGVHILTLVSAQLDWSCWIGCLILPQGHYTVFCVFLLTVL